MIRVPKAVPSRPTYAFNPDTWQELHYRVDAVWFRRKNGVLVATMGTYRPRVRQSNPRPDDDLYQSWIDAANANRYGGEWIASWDGQAIMCADQPTPPDVIAERIQFLDRILKGFPNVPPGWDGWWTFPKPSKA